MGLSFLMSLPCSFQDQCVTNKVGRVTQPFACTEPTDNVTHRFVVQAEEYNMQAQYYVELTYQYTAGL